jgi:hypothetical protein
MFSLICENWRVGTHMKVKGGLLRMWKGNGKGGGIKRVING